MCILAGDAAAPQLPTGAFYFAAPAESLRKPLAPMNQSRFFDGSWEARKPLAAPTVPSFDVSGRLTAK